MTLTYQALRGKGGNMELINTTGGKDLSFINKGLQNATMLIMNIAGKIRNNWFEIGAVIADVDGKEMYKEDGFNDVHEWTARAFNIKKSMSYDLLKIGREYTREILSKSGRVVGYECNLVQPGRDNFNPTQVIRMLPAGHEQAQKLVDSGVITPDMSSVAIGKIVKSLNSKEEEKDDAKEEGPNDNPEQVEEEVTHEEWLRMTFDKITTQELIDELSKRGFVVTQTMNSQSGALI